MSWLLIGLVIAGAAWYFLRQRQRREAVESPVRERKPAAKPVWGKRLVVPSSGKACPEAQKIAGQVFPLDKVPVLPLAGCTSRGNCLCRFETLPEQRGGAERRSGTDRRPDIRYDTEKKPRRSGKDRRAKNHDPFNAGVGD